MDSPVPTKETIDKLYCVFKITHCKFPTCFRKATLKLSDKILTEDGDSTSDQIRGTPENDEAAGYEEDDIEVMPIINYYTFRRKKLRNLLVLISISL